MPAGLTGPLLAFLEADVAAQKAAHAARAGLAVGETVILLTLSLHRY